MPRSHPAMAAPTYVFADRCLADRPPSRCRSLWSRAGRCRCHADRRVQVHEALRFPAAGEDAITGFGDLAPMFNVRWNAGVHNFMTYITGNLTTGRYDPTRLANLGLGHNAIDAGWRYTYFNPQTGYEFSATLGFTYNFENVHTALPERHRHASGCRCFKVSHQTAAGRSRRLSGIISFLATAARAIRVGCFEVAGCRHRAADRLRLPGERATTRGTST